MKLIVFFITIVALFQAVPPPPPPPPGGSELHSIFVVEFDNIGNETGTIEYNKSALRKALNNPGDCIPGTSFCDYFSIMNALENGQLRISRGNDIKQLYDFSQVLGESEIRRVCRFANGPLNPTDRIFRTECKPYLVPIPFVVELFLLLSVFVISFYHSKKFSIFAVAKNR